MCVLTAPLASHSLASLPLLGPSYSLRHNNIEIRLMNNYTTASKCLSERKNQCGKLHCCLIFKNCYSRPNLWQTPLWLFSCHQH